MLKSSTPLTVGSTNNLNSVFAGTFNGAGNISKQGSGSFTISGTNTYAGTTSITAGRVILNGTLTSGGGWVSVGDGSNSDSGMLMGSGTISRAVTVAKGGTIAPGNSAAGSNGGVLRTRDQTWNGGGTYVWEINDASDTTSASAGIKFDQLQISGSLILNASTLDRFILDVTSLTGGGVNGNALNFDKTKNYDWTIATVSGAGVADFTDRFTLLDHFTNDTTGVNGAADGAFSISGSENDVVLHYIAAPEPGMMGLMCVAMLGLLKRRRGNRSWGVLQQTDRTRMVC